LAHQYTVLHTISGIVKEEMTYEMKAKEAVLNAVSFILLK
jgi:hypothetical protein